MQTYRGRWNIKVLEKNAGYNQRVLISGADTGSGAHPGTPGTSFVVDGDRWDLKIQHDDGSGWEDSILYPDPLIESGADLYQKIFSEDLTETPADTHDKNDLILEVEKIGPIFDIEYRPFAVNTGTVEMFPDGIFIGVHEIQYMGVRITNRWGKALHSDTLLEISSLGRQMLLAQGIEALYSWSRAELESTAQEMACNGILVGSLEVGESRTIYFKVDATNARKGKPQVEFLMLRSAGVPDASNNMRLNSHKIFIAEV
ncbi:MAG: hypothetical protein V3T30_03175, partial [Thermodesulfobacteriota bacterium]